MNFFSIAALLGFALFADYAVELAAEMSTDTLLDDDAGAITELAPGPGLDIVNTLPAAAVSWPQPR